ncbi:LOW QUALITY PROTEIN: hypothetical protein HJC23_011881, partial [Cyclotella cryptica]
RTSNLALAWRKDISIAFAALTASLSLGYWARLDDCGHGKVGKLAREILASNGVDVKALERATVAANTKTNNLTIMVTPKVWAC